MTLVRDTIDHLTQVEKLLDQLGPLEEAHTKATTKTELAKSQLAAIEKELSDAQSGLTVTQLKNVRQYEATAFQHSQKIKDLEAEITHKQAILEDITLQVASADAKHKQLEASLDSLRKLHFG